MKRLSADVEAGQEPDQTNSSAAYDAQSKAQSKRLKLKDSSRRKYLRRDKEESDDHSRSRRRRRRPRRRRSPTPVDPHEPEALDPETAFRESLFDAMADDEGAAYWESVYGQPIHVYSDARVGPEGELERMTDEEYAAHVRQKMWEKTPEGMETARKRLGQERRRKEMLEEERRRAERRANREQRKANKLQADMEEVLRMGTERRFRKDWTQAWQDYRERWSRWETALNKEAGLIPWPVKTASVDDVNELAIQNFFETALDRAELGDERFSVAMKDERVRWHPDKFQRQLGGDVDSNTLRAITTAFQVVDALWSDTRRKEH